MPVTRHFLDWNQPALPAAADYLLERYGTRRELDLSKLILVFPGRRAARRMLELLVQKASDRWPAWQPPRMVTFEQFPEMLYPQQKTLADDLTQLLVWKQAMSSVPAAELAAALPSIPGDDAVPSWLALCETLRRQHNELAADGMEFDEVFDALIRHGNDAEAERWKALRRIQSEYLMRMDDLGLWDRQSARLIAVQQRECTTSQDIVLVGTVDMNRIVRQMLDQIAGRVTALVHAAAEEAAAFDEYGCLIPEKWLNRPLNLPLDAARIVDWPAEQARSVVDELAELNGAYRADEIVIGMADDGLVPAVLQSLSDSGVHGRWPVGMQVRSTRPFRLLTAVAQHLGSAREGQPADLATLSDLVRHPDLMEYINQFPGINTARQRSIKETPRCDWLTHLDLYLTEHLQTVPGVFLGKDPRRGIVAKICQAVEHLLVQLVPGNLREHLRVKAVSGRTSQKKKAATSRQKNLYDDPDESDRSISSVLSRRLPLIQWAEGCLRLLSVIYHDRTLNDDNSSDRGISACVQSLQQTVETLRRVPPSVMPATTVSQALQLLLKQIAESNVPSDVDEQAIDLLGWLELPLDDSPVLILTGFNEGKVPESVSSDLFLPNTLRSQLGLTDNHRRYARDAYALLSGLHSRRRVVVIAGRRDSQGNPLAPSRLWFAADPESLPDRVRRFYDPDGSSFQSSEAESIQSSADDVLPELPMESIPRVSGFCIPEPPLPASAPEEISVTAFRDYLYCPYRYYLTRELRLESIEDETRELTAPAFGNLIHEVLNRFGTSPFAHATSPEAIEVYLLSEIRKLSLLRFGRDRSATVSVQLRMLENRLQEFARWQAQTAAQGWRIVRTEEKLRYLEFRDILERPIVLSGRVDRIDQHNVSKQWRILDYKTSETAEKPESTHRARDEWRDLQLPLYRLLVRSIGIEGDMQLGYIHLPGDLSKIGCSIADWELADLESAEQRAREVAAEILDLRIDRVAPGDAHRGDAMSRLCQESVIDRRIPWLTNWPGRSQ